MTYEEFIEQKRIEDKPTGLDIIPDLNPMLFDFQRDITRWALHRGRAAVFADCGLGKTPMQLEWADKVAGRKDRVIVVAPLAVSQQHILEAQKFGVGLRYLRKDDGKTRLVVTNYEMLDRFDPSQFIGIVLDESSILKSYTGKFRTQLINDWGQVPFRLAATATPAPNDFMELGNHAEFLGAMKRTEMLSMFFVHDGGETQKWRLKGHGEQEFWRWLCSWAVMIRKPSDLGYADGDFILPKCHIHEVTVDCHDAPEGYLFALEANTLQERQASRRSSISERVKVAADLANGGGTWLLWCDLNKESANLAKAIYGAVEVHGSQSLDVKEERLLGFSQGKYRALVTKPSIAGHGMNWQHCHNMAFVGLSDSYEQFYQGLRRCWRFGQRHEVNAYVITAKTEGAVVANIKRKEADAQRMQDNMLQHMAELNTEAIHEHRNIDKGEYRATQRQILPDFLTGQSAGVRAGGAG